MFRWSVAAAIAFSSVAGAEPWLPPGNLTIRHDITLLADAGLIRAPITTWPISWPDIASALLATEPNDDTRPDVAAALIRMQRLAQQAMRRGFSGARVDAAAAAKPTRLRTFAASPREEGQLGVSGTWLGDRVALNLTAAAVARPDDGQELRLDGSYLGLTLGNLLVSAGATEKWWGPGWEGSLILSSNARPVPGVTIERNRSKPFQWRGLSWLGPWRATVSMGQLEGGDVAVPDARFFAARVNFRPRPWMEFGLSRTAQWCGQGRPCDLSTFGRLLTGRDNSESESGVSREPGNQMAGYDLRIAAPWRRLPLALYAQLIGEDEAGGLPGKFLGLFGAEVWGGSRWGSHRLHFEYADTSCNFSRREPVFGCAYRNRLYPQGYTFRGRALGHALDGDGRMFAAGALLVQGGGASLSVLVRRMELNRASMAPDLAHTVSPVRNTLNNVELQYNRALAWGELGVGVGFDDDAGQLRSGGEVRGFLEWRQGI